MGTWERTGRDGEAIDATPQDESLIRVAWYYYKDRLTQAQIAERMGMSRASVGRHLDRARDSGLVRIAIEPRALRSLELAQRLCRAFDLQDAIVVPDLRTSTPLNQGAINDRIATGAAQYLEGHLKPGTALGVGFGDTVARTLGACRPSLFSEVTMVTLTGGINTYLFAADGLKSDRLLSLTASMRIIPTPVTASSVELATALRSDVQISGLIEEAAAVDIAIAGIGATSPRATLVQWGFQQAHELEELAENGFVGDVLSLFFDEDGCFCESDISARRIGIGPEEFKSIPLKIGVAGGPDKLGAIRAALKGSMFDVLITTESTTHALLDELDDPLADTTSRTAADR